MCSAISDRGLLYVPVEIKHREMLSRLFLGCCAAEAGFAVVIGRHSELDRYLDAFPVGLFFDKCLSVSKKRSFDRRLGRGFTLTSIDEEAGGVFSMPQFIRARYSQEYLKKSALTFFWSQKHLEIVQKYFPDAAIASAVVGNPRFDLCRPDLRKLFEASAAAIRERYGDFILLVSNFGHANYFAGHAALVDLARKNGLFVGGAEYQNYMGRVEHKARNLEAYANVLPAVRAAFPELAIVVRPHPAERVETWLKIAQPIERCHVIYEGEANPWILASRAMFHHGCTTGLEGFLLDKPSVSFHPHPHEEYDTEPSVSVSLMARDPEELTSKLRQIVEDSAQALPSPAPLHNYVRIDDGYAADRIVAEMLHCAKGQGRLDFSLGNTAYWRKRFDDGWRSWREKLPSPRRIRKAKMSKFPLLAANEISSVISSMSDLTGRFRDIDARPIAHSTYLLRQDS